MKLLPIFLCLLLNAAFAEEGPLNFKGIVLGSELRDYQVAGGFECIKEYSKAADDTCFKYKGETIAGAPVEFITLDFFEKKLGRIYIFFKEDYFDQVVVALAGKYGKGTQSTVPVKNRLGATFTNQIFLWRKAGGTVSAKRYSENLDTSVVILVSNSALKEIEKRSKADLKKNLDDM